MIKKPELLAFRTEIEKSDEKPEKIAKENFNTKYLKKDDNKETKKREVFDEFKQEESPVKDIIKEKAKEENDSSVNESVNLDELESIKVKYFFPFIINLFIYLYLYTIYIHQFLYILYIYFNCLQYFIKI